MSAEFPPHFSEMQLSQIATLIPSLAQKSKASAGATPIRNETKVLGVQTDTQLLSDDETKNGILRLADFFDRKKKKAEKPPLQVQSLPIDFVLVLSPRDLMTQALKIYRRTDRALDKNKICGANLNKFL